MATKITKNFTLEELTKSSTAQRLKIDNTPSKKDIEYMTALCEKILQPIRDAWGEPIVVSSCYRCPKLNTAVGGAKNSDHKFGCAVDCHTVSDKLEDNMKLFKLVENMIKLKKINVRQLIFEYGVKSKGPDWVHISINNEYNSHRDNQILYLGCK